MKIKRYCFIGLASLLIGCGPKQVESACNPAKGSEACFDIELNTYEIEENASIVIGGVPTAFADALIVLWDETYPQYAGMIETKSSHDYTSAIEATYARYDIVLTYEELSGAYQEQLLPLEETLLRETYPLTYQETKTLKDLLSSSKTEGKMNGEKVDDKAEQKVSEETVDKKDDEKASDDKGRTIDEVHASSGKDIDDTGKEDITQKNTPGEDIQIGPDQPLYPAFNDRLVVDAIKPYYIPVAYEGAAFFYNKTMLETLGIDISIDANGNDMPDSIETWENIFALADAWEVERPIYRKKPVNIVFPFSLNEHYLSYFMFTGNGFRLFPDHDGMNPGFQSNEFVKGLQFIAEASKHAMAVHENQSRYTASDYTWQWEKVFTNQTAPFGLVAPWMNLEGAAKANKVEYVVTPALPTYQNTPLVPFVTTLGYVIKADTRYPSAAHAVMQFLLREEVMQAMIDTTPLIPAIHNGNRLDFSTQLNRANVQATLAMADNQPLIAMPNNVYKKALDGYYEISLMDVVRRLWDGVIDPFQAQSEINFLYQQWLFDNTNVKLPLTSKP